MTRNQRTHIKTLAEETFSDEIKENDIQRITRILDIQRDVLGKNNIEEIVEIILGRLLNSLGIKDSAILMKTLSGKYHLWKSVPGDKSSEFKGVDKTNVEQWIRTRMRKQIKTDDPFVTNIGGGLKKYLFILPIRFESNFYGWLLATRIFKEIKLVTEYMKLIKTFSDTLALSIFRLDKDRASLINKTVSIRDFTSIVDKRSDIVQPDQVFNFTLSLMQPIFQWSAAVVYTYSAEEKIFYPISSYGTPERISSPLNIGMNVPYLKNILSKKTPVYVSNKTAPSPPTTSKNAKQWIFVPIHFNNKLIGGLGIDRNNRKRLKKDEVDILVNVIGESFKILARLNEFIQAENYNREILDSLSTGVVVLDRQCGVLLVNRTFDKMFKITSQNERKHILNEFTKMVDISTISNNAMTKTLDVLTPFIKIPVRVYVSPLSDSDNNCIGHVFVIEDITIQKELEEKMQKSARLASIGEIASGIAHEIRNPLTSLKGFSQLLPTKYDNPDFRKRFSDIIHREINRLDNLIDNLMSLAKPVFREFTAVSLERVLDNTLVLLSPRFHSNKITLSKDYVKKQYFALGDEYKLEQVFLNLSLNAIQAMPEGGEFRVELKRFSKPMPLSDSPIKMIKIIFSDTGIGMSEETLKKIFTPFYTTKPAGTGLGLSIAQRIIHEHKGEIICYSKPNKGTRIYIILPEYFKDKG